jgi:hypothetical protein
MQLPFADENRKHGAQSRDFPRLVAFQRFSSNPRAAVGRSGQNSPDGGLRMQPVRRLARRVASTRLASSIARHGVAFARGAALSGLEIRPATIIGVC